MADNAHFNPAAGTPANGTQKSNGATVPPHVRSQNGSSNTIWAPPHLRMKTSSGFVTNAPHQRQGDANGVSGKSPNSKASASPTNNPLVTDGNVDTPETALIRQKAALARQLTPPLSPKATEAQVTSAVQRLSIPDGPWKPQPIADLPPPAPSLTSKTPSSENTTSFSSHFLRTHLGGNLWGPGLVFVPPPQPSILPDRVYYTCDPASDPHLPPAPGQHGAKLVPFFRANPEDSPDFDLPDAFDSTSNVPLFVLRSARYVYFGHYTQCRWSDRLDHDRMAQCVSPAVREHWAGWLASATRPAWVTEALRKHFFPEPAYGGALPAVAEDEGGSVAEDEMAVREAKVARDVKRYVEALRVWKKDADMKTNLIKADFVLEAFDQADADEPKALRLWWEYLECVDWRADFYDTLVTLQSRDPQYA
ncbi:hypothetical protein PMIN04_000865 [Paraphaeosphaeria minitans]